MTILPQNSTNGNLEKPLSTLPPPPRLQGTCFLTGERSCSEIIPCFAGLMSLDTLLSEAPFPPFPPPLSPLLSAERAFPCFAGLTSLDTLRSPAPFPPFLPLLLLLSAERALTVAQIDKAPTPPTNQYFCETFQSLGRVGACQKLSVGM